MSKIAKKKKLLPVFVIFSLVLFLSLFLFALWTEAQSPECMGNCNECSHADCDLRPDRCEWDGVESECCRKLEIGWPKSPMGTLMNGCTTLPVMIKYFYEWGVLLGGLATFIALVMAGFQYLTSVGDPNKMKDARGNIISAILGLTLVLASWLVLNTINPDLTTFHNVTFNPVDVNALLEKFTTGETEPCVLAEVYKEKNYGKGSGFYILPWRRHWPLTGGWTTEYVKETFGLIKSVRMFVQCDLCSASDTEADVGLPAAEQKCLEKIKFDGSSVYYIKDGFIDPDDPTKSCTQWQLGAPIQYDVILDREAYFHPGGACTLQLSSGKAWWDIFGEFCADRIGETAGSHPNLDNLTDRTIDCVKLIKHEAGKF